MYLLRLFTFRTIFLCLLVLSLSPLTAKDSVALNQDHELTLYVIPTLHPLDWSTPGSLYKTMLRTYLKTFFVDKNYLLGHLTVKISSPLLDKPLRIAMTSDDKWEKLHLIVNEKVGLGVMCAAWDGKIESEKHIERMHNVYKRREKVAFIRYKVNETALRRMLSFFQTYTSETESEHLPSAYYGGAFWPLYYDEGSGCSAFGAAMLDVANLLTPETEDWVVRRKIPMNLVGGHFNNKKRVKTRSIRKSEQWFEGEGVENVDYVDYYIYEPSIMFNWILDKRVNQADQYEAIEEDGVPGVIVDRTDVEVPEDAPIFTPRPVPNLFIESFKKATGLTKE